MVQDLVKLINLDKKGVYPYEVCLQVHPVERGWFPYIISDLCCIHSMMFSVRAFVDGASPGNQISRQAAFHYAQTLQLLQARLNAFVQGQREMVLCDATIMVIIILAAAAELTGDCAAVENHIDGLLTIVRLRGGVGSLNTHNNLQVKVCSHAPYEAQINDLVDALDSKLGNCWKDLHAFSCMSNVAYQTTRKLSPETYNEMMISILYRLMRLSFEHGSLHEAIRSGLLTFSSTLFLTRQYMTQPYEHLFDLFSSTLFTLAQSTSVVLPPPVVLWLVILYHVVACQKPCPGDWPSVWLGQAVSLTRVKTWPEAHRILTSIMWVDFVHDAAGKKAFEAAVQRLETLPEVDI
ncbi:MAG: hypothetical protein M1838_002952 [Thelocarpon superellum]|nr:MAG: hypothetical protein M1838_002952 [Thelocarpon superellum]